MPKIAAVLLLALLVVPLCSAATLPELFKQAKDEFSAGNYKQSLADFDALDAMSRKPELQGERLKLAPAILFYRGANLAAMGKKDEAKEAFISYLSYMPNASIANPPFAKDVVAVFDTARKETEGKNNTIEAMYARFTTAPDWHPPANETWADSPVRYLLTAEQKAQYAALKTPADREAFVNAFWAALDPTPGTPQNEFRAELERRIAFADAHFATARSAGSATERAAVFAFLGTPTYIGVAQLHANEDALSALRSGGNSDITRGAQAKANVGAMTGATSGDAPVDNKLESNVRGDMRESWYYRRNRLPAGVQAREVRFDFITKEGYGTGVMQKDSEPMQALGQAVEAAKRDKKLNQ